MTDTPKQPPAQPPIKDAVPDGEAPKPVEMRQLTFSQQFFIWSMVVLVGLVFGVGASFGLAFAPSATIAGIAEGEVIHRMQVAERLERVLNPNGHPFYPKFTQSRMQENMLEAYAIDLRLARVGEARGLMPKGQGLEQLEREFLAMPIDGARGRSNLDALREHEGGVDQVARSDLRRFLAERASRESLFMRSAIPPAVPRAVAADVAALRGDRAELAEVVLSGARFIEPVAVDDPEVAAAYERLRASRFTRPGGVVASVAVADRATQMATIEVSDEDVQAWYASHQDRFLGEADAKDPASKPTPKPLDEVRDEVARQLREHRAGEAAQRLMDTFNQEAEALEHDKDPTRFRAAAEQAGLKVVELELEDRTPGTVELGALGTVKDVMRLFSREHEPGFLTQPLATSEGNWVMLRLDSRREPGFRELDAVRDEVARYVAGRRAWKPLREAALAVQAALDGEGALAAWTASEDAKAWGASLTTRPVPLTTRLPTPAEQADGLAGEPLLVAALAMPGRAVALVAAEPDFEGDVPRVRLAQVGTLTETGREGLAEAPLAEVYRQSLRRFGLVLFDRELQAQLGTR